MPYVKFMAAAGSQSWLGLAPLSAMKNLYKYLFYIYIFAILFIRRPMRGHGDARRRATKERQFSRRNYVHRILVFPSLASTLA